MRAAALELGNLLERIGLRLLIYQTVRTLDEQAALYAMGRTVPGVIRTNAKPGASLHNPDENGEAWAFDAVPTVGGKPLWNDAAALRAMGELGESLGLEWAGRWRGPLRESVHFQIRKGAKNA